MSVHVFFSPTSHIFDGKIVAGVSARLRSVIATFSAAYGHDLRDLETPQFLKYRPGDGYGLHRDAGAGEASRRELSAVVFLDDAFSGGELRLYHREGPLRLCFTPTIEPGALVLFRSMTLHEVAPVVTGARHTIVSWIG
jgi:predicted 2-oxoglutarate/Fe(II)-dependent dioxygenase YbiX